MKIAFVVPQARQGSTMIGRVLPIASRWADKHDIHVLQLGEPAQAKDISFHQIGQEPFRRTPQGKKRYRGVQLILSMLRTAGRTAWRLHRLEPDVVVVIKTLPHTILGVRLWQLVDGKHYTILDVDDFELVANRLSSLTQRAAVHWAERVGAKLADHIVAATPFLADHFAQLTEGSNNVTLLPTGLSLDLPLPLSAPTNPTITYFGSLSESSGHRIDLLPKILQRVQQANPKAKLLIAGDGDDRAKLEQSFTEHSLTDSVVWHGRFADNELPTLLDKTTVLIDPIDDSVTQRAKSSYRVALAAVAGKPVVSSNIGVRPHFLPLELQQKFFATPADPTSYAEKIASLLDSPLTEAERQMLVEHSSRYTWENLCQQYSKLLPAS